MSTGTAEQITQSCFFQVLPLACSAILSLRRSLSGNGNCATVIMEQVNRPSLSPSLYNFPIKLLCYLTKQCFLRFKGTRQVYKSLVPL